MLQPARRIRGEISVLFGENLPCFIVFIDLHEECAIADVKPQGVVDLRLIQLRLGQEGIGRGSKSEVQENFGEWKVIESAFHIDEVSRWPDLLAQTPQSVPG